jgi:hypothetical protein
VSDEDDPKPRKLSDTAASQNARAAPRRTFSTDNSDDEEYQLPKHPQTDLPTRLRAAPRRSFSLSDSDDEPEPKATGDEDALNAPSVQFRIGLPQVLLKRLPRASAPDDLRAFQWDSDSDDDLKPCTRAAPKIPPIARSVPRRGFELDGSDDDTRS